MSALAYTAVDRVIALGALSAGLTPSDTAGFALATAEVTFWGLCADCQLSAPLPHDTPPATPKEIHD